MNPVHVWGGRSTSVELILPPVTTPYLFILLNGKMVWHVIAFHATPII